MRTKFKFLLIVILTCIMCFSIAGCDNTVYHWKIEKNIDEITSIQIVDYGSNQLDVIREIDKESYKKIIDDIESLSARRYGWNLASSSGRSVKVSFIDGTYDIISFYEPHHNIIGEDGSFHWTISWLYFDEIEFSTFIEKWTEHIDIEGQFYTLREAYKKGILPSYNLGPLAKRINSADDFSIEEADPKILQSVKQLYFDTMISDMEKQAQVNADVNDISDIKFYGVVKQCYCFKIRNPYKDYPATEESIKITNVKFKYSGPEPLIWKNLKTD